MNENELVSFLFWMKGSIFSLFSFCGSLSQYPLKLLKITPYWLKLNCIHSCWCWQLENVLYTFSMIVKRHIVNIGSVHIKTCPLLREKSCRSIRRQSVSSREQILFELNGLLLLTTQNQKILLWILVVLEVKAVVLASNTASVLGTVSVEK